MMKFILNLIRLMLGGKRPKTPSINPEYKIKFKEISQDRLMTEFEDLSIQNKPLHRLILDLAQFVHDEYNKDLTITMIGRTQKEQDNIYAGKTRNGRSYDENPWKSPHQFSQAVDIRSRIFTEKEIKEIEDYLNAKYNQDNYYKWTAKCHNVGRGDHFHIQYYKER